MGPSGHRFKVLAFTGNWQTFEVLLGFASEERRLEVRDHCETLGCFLFSHAGRSMTAEFTTEFARNGGCCGEWRPNHLVSKYCSSPKCMAWDWNALGLERGNQVSTGTFPILSRDPSFQETITNPGETDPFFLERLLKTINRESTPRELDFSRSTNHFAACWPPFFRNDA